MTTRCTNSPIRRICAVAVCLLLVVASGVVYFEEWNSHSTKESSAAPEPVRNSLVPKPLISNASCSANACHGGPAHDALSNSKPLAERWNSAASLWHAVDPHSGTYSLLTDRPNRSVQVTAEKMIQRLGLEWKSLATEEPRCLACHTDPALAVASASTSQRAEGVGCQACHGQAVNWLTDHTTWTGVRGPKYTATAMTPLFDLSARANACAGCHIGAPKSAIAPLRDVNHDMIAAGHPKLTFDFAEHHRRLPKHWTEKGIALPGANFEIRLWLVGEVEQRKAICAQLADRTKFGKPWPELAEFRCSSCHRAIPKEDSSATERVGTQAWRSSETLVTVDVDQPQFKTLRAAMQQRPRPDSTAIVKLASAAKSELEELTTRVANTPDGELPKLLLDGIRAAYNRAGESEDLIAVLHALSALERNSRRQTPGLVRLKSADFDDAYAHARGQCWKSLREKLDAMLGKLNNE